MSKATRSPPFLKRHKNKFVLLAILTLATILSTVYFYGPSWINGSDNYIYTFEAHIVAQGHFSYLSIPGEDNSKFLLIGGIALFFSLFGYSLFVASLFGLTCLLLTIVVIYLIGKELYDPNAGLISALLYAVFPLVLVEGPTVGDDVPMAFFITLSVLLMIKGIKSKRKPSKYLFLAGFVSLINVLVVPEAVIGTFFIFAYICGTAISKRTKPDAINIGFFALGAVLAALVIVAAGVAVASNPMFVFGTYSQNLNAYTATPAFSIYISDLFSNNVQYSLSNGISNLLQIGNFNTLVFGYFGPVFAISILYLILQLRKQAVVPAAWFCVALLYLGFGSQSFTKYLPMIFVIRFAIIFIPAIVILIGIALADALRTYAKRKNTSTMTYLVTFSTISLLAISSIIIIGYLNYSQYRGTVPLLQIGDYLNNLPQNSTIFGPVDIPWSTYTSQNNATSLAYLISQKTCANVTGDFKLEPGDYLVGNLTNPSSCSMVEVFHPYEVQSLNNYQAFSNWGVNFYLINIYRYLPAAPGP